jgi:predicted RNA-binding protein YlqC (UPF0109 family)
MTSVAPAPSEKVTSTSSSKTASTHASSSDGASTGMTAGTSPNDANNSNSNNSNSNSTQHNTDVLFQAIASKASSAMSQPTVTLTIYIPSTAVGAVIGRRGQNIASLQKTAAMSAHTSQAVRVSIVGQADTANGTSNGNDDGDYPLSDNHNHNNPSMMTTSTNSNNNNNNSNATTSSIPYTYSKLDWSDIAWTPVVVRADPCAALAAAYKLSDMVDGAIDQVVLDIPISRNKHAAIVGKRGVALATMSSECAVRIMVPNKMTRHDVVQLEGDLDNVCQCLVRVLSSAAKAKQSSSTSTTTGNSKNGGDQDLAEPSAATHVTTNTVTSGSSSITYTVMTLTVPQLPSQTKIRSVGRKTDCTIKKKKMDSSQWQLTVSGRIAEQVQAAVAILHKWKDDNATSGSGGGAAAGASANSPTPVATSDGADNSTTGTPSTPSRRNNNRGRGGGGGGGGGRNSNSNSKGSTPSKRGGKPQQNRTTNSSD